MHQEVKFDYIAELTGTRDQFEYLNESRHSIYATTDKPVYNVCNPTLNVKFLFISYAPNFTSLRFQSISNVHYMVHLIFIDTHPAQFLRCEQINMMTNT